MKKQIIKNIIVVSLAAIFAAPAAAFAGTVTVSGFSPAREHAIVQRAEAVAFSGHIGKISATCGGQKIAIPPADEAEPITTLDKQLFRACPGRGLAVTIVTKPNPSLVK